MRQLFCVNKKRHVISTCDVYYKNGSVKAEIFTHKFQNNEVLNRKNMVTNSKNNHL